MRPLAHFEKRYAICEDGRIINLANNTPLTPIKNPNGYYKVGLAMGDGTQKQQLIHILVARHFLPNPYGHSQVNHKDGVKGNNHVSNLEWVSPQENILHALQTGLRPGFISADDKEKYLQEVLQGTQIKDLAIRINRRAETLHKMLRQTAMRLGIHAEWQTKMKENRSAAALRNLAKINN